MREWAGGAVLLAPPAAAAVFVVFPFVQNMSKFIICINQ